MSDLVHDVAAESAKLDEGTQQPSPSEGWLAAEIARVLQLLARTSFGDPYFGRTPMFGVGSKENGDWEWAEIYGPQHYAVRKGDAEAKLSMYESMEREAEYVTALCQLAPDLLRFTASALSGGDALASSTTDDGPARNTNQDPPQRHEPGAPQ